ncbi:hypothetical protein GCM10009038_15760 [Salinicola rhizosphaerae]|uniref:Uncharacterized protein n=1 Tax=Salinicola rhizosphaerae TaxID=1443141 RepID=A0ABQ3E2S5_9GAMM|nr:hypothetical protein GCM10009038_15760 [Salinicola rhizosphaerae]
MTLSDTSEYMAARTKNFSSLDNGLLPTRHRAAGSSPAADGGLSGTAPRNC